MPTSPDPHPPIAHPDRRIGPNSASSRSATLLSDTVEIAELVAQPRHHGPLGEGGASDTDGLWRDLPDRFRTKTHGSPHGRNKPPAFGGRLGRSDPWPDQDGKYHAVR